MAEHGASSTAPPDPPSAPPPQPTGMPRWLLPTLLGGAAVIVILLVVVIVLLVSGGGDDSNTATDDPSESKTKTFEVSGDITLTDSDILIVGQECIGQNGYDDMAPGAQVVVRDSTGKTLAASHLQAGEKLSSVQCRFPFSVADVPEGAGPYSLEVSHRGQITFEQADASDLHFTLS